VYPGQRGVVHDVAGHSKVLGVVREALDDGGYRVISNEDHIVVDLDVDGVAFRHGLPVAEPPMANLIVSRRNMFGVVGAGSKEFVQIGEVVLVVRVDREDDLIQDSTVGSKISLRAAQSVDIVSIESY
jgi:hypothetical protein